ncbi:MAG TPA: GatB/YqeY domain-containing protein [Polyangiaceae bacterium]|nr:GatB/YqeY domain-containing protein [Polyangiaceae bacterium]
MSLGAEIKKAMFAAMKAKNDVEKEIFRVALGEIDTAASRSESDQLSDAEIQAIIKKLIKSNREAHDATSNQATRDKLLLESAALERFLPKALSLEQIVALLSPVAAQIKAAPSQGPAMGIAMKVLKSSGAEVNTPDVTQAVAQIRA